MPTVVKVRWAPAPPAEQVSSYVVLESRNGAAFTQKAIVPATASPLGLDINNPLSGVYRYKVKAQNLAGDSPESDEGASPDLPTKPATPTVEVVVS